MNNQTNYDIIFFEYDNYDVNKAQGVDFPSTPSQAPIGGLELLIGAGGAMAWSELKNRKK